MARISVVLPQPLGPSSAVREPVGTLSEALRSSVLSPAFSVIQRSSMAVFAATGRFAPSSMRMDTSSRGRSFTSSWAMRLSSCLRALWSWPEIWRLSILCSRASLLPMRVGVFFIWHWRS